MKVKAVIGFVGTVGGVKYRVSAGQVLDLPEGADWLRAGLVVAEEVVTIDTSDGVQADEASAAGAVLAAAPKKRRKAAGNA